ncbi:hypothetical protein GCM10010121_059300 [Streptomyces brasiliensis]|uniref:Uncharacterized protein n=1 Tax=Streptomyces brasiliensis TaxID=1954 RepID=A0A917L378_9ACTN|nr:hypothetical protein GCM10010121_059300 [Streptomyces brasiliensis]
MPEADVLIVITIANVLAVAGLSAAGVLFQIAEDLSLGTRMCGRAAATRGRRGPRKPDRHVARRGNPIPWYSRSLLALVTWLRAGRVDL